MSSLEIQAGITLGDVASKVDGLSKRFDQFEQSHDLSQVRMFNPVAPLASAGAAPVLADLGGPNESYVWVVRRVSLAPVPGGAIPTLGTSLFICKGQSIGVGNQNVVDVAPTLPTAATYGFGEFVIRAPDNLIVYWVGGTNSILIDCDVSEHRRSQKLITF